MAEKAAFCVPIKGAMYTFEYRDTGGTWSTPERMVGGVRPAIGFTSPVCDELRITATSTDSVAVDWIHLAAMSIASGLTFDSSQGLSAEPQPTIQRPSSSGNNHFTFQVPETDSTTHTLTINGIAQRRLDIRQFFFAKTAWEPRLNYENGEQQLSGIVYLDQSTVSANYQSKSGAGRATAVEFQLETEDKALDLSHLEKNLTNDGFCLFVRDTLNPVLRQDYAYASNIRVTGITRTAFEKFTINAEIKEAFEQ